MRLFRICAPVLLVAVLASADHGGHNHNHRQQRRQQRRRGRQQEAQEVSVPGGVDFAGCEMQDDGMCCVMKEQEIQTVAKDPILECTHKEVEKCHYTYVTQFTPAQEEVCEENFEKRCQITFKQMAVTEPVRKCYRPLIKTCGGGEDLARRLRRQLPTYGDTQVQDSSQAEGFDAPPPPVAEERCETFYESACTTKYIEKQPGKFVGDTTCEKLPIELCGQGCQVEEGEEECHDKEVTSLIDVPEEVCDLNPQKTCRFQTKLVPSLKPEHECTIIPQEICNLKFSNPRPETKPLMTKWCIDPTAEVEPDTGSYDETEAAAEPLGPGPDAADDSAAQAQAPAGYAGPGGAPLGDFDDGALPDSQPPPPPPPPIDNSTPLGQDYGAPSGASDTRGAPTPDFAPSASAPRGQQQQPAQRGGPRRNGGGGGRRRNGGGGRRRNGGNGGGTRRAQATPNTLYDAPAPGGASGSLADFQDELPAYGAAAAAASAPLPAYGAASAPLPSYGAAPVDSLPSYNRNNVAPSQNPYSARSARG